MTQIEARGQEHVVVDPAILYFGTPVLLISTVDTHGAVNLMPMSSAFWLGHTCVLGLGTRSQTYTNLLSTRECVLNLPSADLVANVNRLALTTGRNPVSARKTSVGYRYVPDKFARANLTPAPSHTVTPPRVMECPVNLEARVVNVQPLEKDDTVEAGTTAAVEVAVTRVQVHQSIRQNGTKHRVDPDKWRPLIMSFQHFYGLGDRLHFSDLASIDEEYYR